MIILKFRTIDCVMPNKNIMNYNCVYILLLLQIKNTQYILNFNTRRYCSVHKIDAISIIWRVVFQPPPAINNSPVGRTMQPL